MSIVSSGIRLRTFSTYLSSTVSTCSPPRRLQRWPPFQQVARSLETATLVNSDVPYRKQLKDKAKQRRAAGESKHDDVKKIKEARAEHWELTVGIEVHAQLNTERKLFSRRVYNLNLIYGRRLI